MAECAIEVEHAGMNGMRKIYRLVRSCLCRRGKERSLQDQQRRNANDHENDRRGKYPVGDIWVPEHFTYPIAQAIGPFSVGYPSAAPRPGSRLTYRLVVGMLIHVERETQIADELKCKEDDG